MNLPTVTVQLTPPASLALVRLVERERMSRTDVINRALLGLDVLLAELASGKRLYLISEDGTREEVRLQ